MKKILLVSTFAVMALACSACNDSQKVEKGNTEQDDSYTLSVFIDDEAAGDVTVAEMQDKVQTVTSNGSESQAIAISDIIIQSTGLTESDLGNYMCDYESGDDGFRPSKKGDKCPPVSCTLTTKSYFNVESNNLFYADDAPQKNGCYNVKNVSKVLMYTVDESAVEISIYLDGEFVKKVDASKLNIVTSSDGKKAVKLEDLIKAAGKDGLDLAKTLCDFRTTTANDIVSNVDSSCAASSCSDLKDQLVILETRTVSDEKDAKACYEVSDVDAVYMASVVDKYDKREIEVIVNGKSAGKIDIATMTDKFVKSSLIDVIKVSDILTALGIDANLATSKCEGVSQSTNYRPSSKDRCSTLLSCDVVAKGTVAVITGKLVIPDTENCYNTGDFDTLEITTDGTTPPEPGTDKYIVKVVVDNKDTKEVDISTLDKDNDGKVAISDILAEAGVTTDLDKSKCEAVSIAGNYRPSNKGKCKELLSCDVLAAGFVSLDETHKVSGDGMDDSCYATDKMDQIEVTTTTEEDPGEGEAYIVSVYVDGEKAKDVDITKLEKNAGGFVYISTILTAAGVNVDLATAKCEGVASDGYRPSTGKNEACHELLSCEDFAKGDVSLDDKHKLVIKDAEGCYGTKNLNRIDIVTK